MVSLQRRSAAEAATAALDGAKRQADEEEERAAREKTKRQRLEDDNRVGGGPGWPRDIALGTPKQLHVGARADGGVPGDTGFRACKGSAGFVAH